MAITCGILALVHAIGSYAFAMYRATTGELQKAHNSEMEAIGWFIIAALCLR